MQQLAQTVGVDAAGEHWRTVKTFPDIACRELLSQCLGTPLERVDSAHIMAAWAEARELPYGLSLEKYDDDTWDCFAVGGWLIEAVVWEDDWEHKWALKLRAVPEDRWVQLTQLLGEGPSRLQPLAKMAPTLRHPLFDPDWTVRHRGGAWGRETTREFKSLDEATVRASAAQWSAQFLDDLPRADRWIKGEHRDSDALVSDTWLRLMPSRLAMSIYAAPRVGDERPAFREVFGRLDDLSSVRRTGPLGWIPKELPNTWSVEQARSGDLLEFHVPHFDMLSEKDVAATADVLDRMESEFWVYELRSMGPYSGNDLRDFWRQWMSDETSADDHAVGAPVAAYLQLLVATRAPGKRISFAKAMEGLAMETSKFRPDGPFGDLLADVPSTCDLEESAAGDALLLTVNSMDLTSADVESLEGILKHAKKASAFSRP